MLDIETKRRIDTARDILVGKVPDPKSQVEQITIALVYKFMDDMDKESLEMGGKAAFFSGEFEKYGWSKIFDPHMGGFEMLALYADAITRMSQNPNLPQLFRDIFKNAYLPYRDPETLKLFLKTINDFSYDQSERLGDAFEYLLSVMSSQGDAGQFRTPRHIIDFMVQVVKPQKNETILDPACGTAGFLISAYKYILNDPANKKNYPGDLLSPEDKKKLLTNFKGYDISPDMVRLSLVNMYLHGFVQPQIYEYDTLTSEERWNDYADVILANPPFMSPKGGIKPHKRFTVQSNRSEVLFVDYMAEHLTPAGRAAIIVPEGIIFQSAGAYKQLRKYLVEQNYLWAVASLPAGVFNPYSGVKTSILFLDRTLAKKSEQVLFVKIEADGYDLGAQRRPVDRNDIPDALNVLADWQNAVRNTKAVDFSAQDRPYSALLVAKARLAENDEYNLIGDRYRENTRSKQQKWPLVVLGDVCEEIKSGFAYGHSVRDDTGVPHLRPMNITIAGNLSLDDIKYIPADEKEQFAGFLLNKGDVLFNNTNSKELVGKTCLIDKDLDCFFSNHMTRIRTKASLKPAYLAHVLHSLWREGHFLNLCNKWVGQAAVNGKTLSTVQIPLPPLEIQRQLVEEIDSCQRIITGARQVVEAWKPNLELELEDERKSAGVDAWDVVELGDVCSFVRGPFGGSLKKEIFVKEGYLVYEQYHAINNDFEFGRYFIDENKFQEMKRFEVYSGDILISCSGTMGKVTIVPTSFKKGIINQALLKLTPLVERIDVVFLKYALESQAIQEKHFSNQPGVAIQNVASVGALKQIELSLPPLEIQRVIVERIESERRAVDGNRALIAAYEAKIQKIIAQVWEG